MAAQATTRGCPYDFMRGITAKFAHCFDDAHFRGDVLIADIRNFACDVFRNRHDAVAIRVKQIIRVNRDAADVHQNVNLGTTRIPVRANRTVRKSRETEFTNLIEIASRAEFTRLVSVSVRVMVSICLQTRPSAHPSSKKGCFVKKSKYSGEMDRNKLTPRP